MTPTSALRYLAAARGVSSVTVVALTVIAPPSGRSRAAIGALADELGRERPSRGGVTLPHLGGQDDDA